MDELPERPAAPVRRSGDRGLRLDSWKEIAAHLNRDVRTVQRWEKTANLPVRRLQKHGLRAVFAYAADLDDWLRQQGPGADDASSDKAADQTGDESVSPQRGRRWVPYAGAAALLAIIAAFILWRKPPAPLGPFTTRPITSDPGIERDPDISPDGKYVAYAAETPELHSRILVRLMDGGEAHAITSSPDDEWSPAWSPDGERIAFLRGDLAGNATLLITSALGGDERTVTEVRAYPRGRTLLIGHLVAWTPDGRHLVVPDRGADTKGLVLIDTGSGHRSPLTSPAEGEFDVEPSLSSDGRLLLFSRIRGQTLSSVFVETLDSAFRPSGSPRKLPPAGDWNGTPRLLEDRHEVLICAGSVPRLALWRVPLNGSAKPVSLGIIGDHAVQSAIDRSNGRKTGRIVFRTFRIEFDILGFPIPAATHGTTPEAGPGTTPKDPPVHGFIESTFVERSAAYSPDGSEVAFISDRTGRRQLWVSGGAGEKPVEWTQPFEADFQTPAWSPDGSRIVFTGEGPAGLDQLFVAGRDTRTAVRVTNDGLDYEGAVWSYDGANLYAAAGVNNVHSIYRLPSAGGAAEKLFPGYADVAGVEPTGKGLYAVRRVGRNLTQLDYVPFPDGPPVHLAAMNFQEDAWVAREGIYYLERRADMPLAPVALMYRTHAGAAKLLEEYTKPPGRGLSVSADGRFAVTTRVVPPISDLMLLEPAR